MAHQIRDVQRMHSRLAPAIFSLVPQPSKPKALNPSSSADRSPGLFYRLVRKNIVVLRQSKKLLKFGCASPKLRLACIFNNFIKLLAARSGDVVRRLPRSRLPLPNPAAASLSAPAHPYTKINVFWNGDTTTKHIMPSWRSITVGILGLA